VTVAGPPQAAKGTGNEKGKNERMNGLKIYMAILAGVLGLVGIVLGLLLSTIMEDVHDVETTLTGYLKDGRLETPQQKQDRVDARVVHHIQVLKRELSDELSLRLVATIRKEVPPAEVRDKLNDHETRLREIESGK
jgi:hypothetical protein